MLRSFSKKIPGYFQDNMIPQRFQYLFKEQVIPLGRWSNDSNEETKKMRAAFANHDSCGDRLCGDPLILKENINNIIKNE